MNNWSQKPYILNEPSGSGNYAKAFKAGASNSFWLEPTVYFGPPIEVAGIAVSAGALCYRLQFANGDMSDVWSGLYFFPRGDQPLSTAVDGNGDPVPAANTERLQANTTLDAGPAVISLYVDTTDDKPPSRFRVRVTKGGPIGGGWGGGHN